MWRGDFGNANIEAQYAREIGIERRCANDEEGRQAFGFALSPCLERDLWADTGRLAHCESKRGR